MVVALAAGAERSAVLKVGLSLPVYRQPQTCRCTALADVMCQQLTFVLICASLRKPRDDLVNIRFWEHLDRGRPHVPQGGQRQEKLGHSLIVGGLGVDDEVICSHGEIAGLDVNAKLFAQLPSGRSTLRNFLDGPNTLIGEIAEKHVRGHVDSPLTKKQWT